MSKITGSYGRSMFKFLRNPKPLTHFHSYNFKVDLIIRQKQWDCSNQTSGWAQRGLFFRNTDYSS